MGDLQRGERYVQSLCCRTQADRDLSFCNVNPLVAISMAGNNLRLDLVLSYDIVCI